MTGGARHPVLIDIARDLPRVLADRQRIVQVLNNLLSNAARHSPEATPIRIAAEKTGLHVAVSITDEGRGVSPERLAKLFGKYTVDGKGARGIGGGLGLAICKGLVEAHGGRIRAESGGVTWHTFTLHAAGAEAADTVRFRAGPPQRGDPRSAGAARTWRWMRPSDAPLCAATRSRGGYTRSSPEITGKLPRILGRRTRPVPC